MSEKTIILSSAGLKNIVETGKEFTFIFDKYEIRMNNVFAEFISPIVSRLHLSDPTIETIQYDNLSNQNQTTYDELFNEEMQNIIQQIAKGFPISINSEQAIKIQQIAILLCNDELLNLIEELYPQEINDTNFDSYLNKLNFFQNQTINNIFSEYIDFESLIDVISSNFYQIDRNKMKTLSKSLLYKIISNEHLKIESEDSLFEFIQEIFDTSEEYQEEKHSSEKNIYDFYEQVEIVGLSEEKFKEFVVCFNPTFITNQLWNNIISRFLDKHSKEERYCQNKQSVGEALSK